MELPDICFIFPYIFIGISIIIHIVTFLLILKFIPNVEKLPFLWGMINWTIAIGVVFSFIENFIANISPLSKILITSIIPSITADIGRFIVFSFIYKSKNHHFNNSFIFGAGHGGWESIIAMLINQLPLLLNFYAIKEAKNEEELVNKNLIKIYEKYKDGIPVEEIFGVIIRFLGNLFHIGACVIIYKLSFNRKEKKYINILLFYLLLISLLIYLVN